MVTTTQADTIPLRLASGNGPITRHILRAPPRDATTDEIPIIDISALLPSPGSCSTDEARLSIAKQIHAAATNTGFFYINNHGIPSSITDAARAACLDFFRQDLEVKLEAHATQSAYFNGYKPPRTQRINPFEGVDVRESFSWTYDPRLDPAALAAAAAAAKGDKTTTLDSIPEEIRKFLRVEPDGPPGSEENRFPWSMTQRTVPHFQPAVLTYWRACLVLARALVRAFALSLDLDEGFFDEKFTYPDAALALNYYPPLPHQASPTIGDKDAATTTTATTAAVSIGSHTDFQLFTILWQDSVGGLQVLNRQGQWINARPIPGTFVVNIADYLQRITNGKYQSTVHRAMNSSGKERVSMPFFFGFNLNESCAVLDSCVGDDGMRKYDEIGCLEWVRRRVKAMHDIKEAEAEEEDQAN